MANIRIRYENTAKDPDIALAYLNVWFGNEPFSADLKKTLLKLTN